METSDKNISLNKPKTIFNSKRKRQDFIFIWLMLLGTLASFALFWVFANVKTMFMAFQKPIDEKHVIFTWENFRGVYEALTGPDPKMRNAFYNTMIAFVFNNGIGFPIQIIFSYFLYKKVFGAPVFRVVFFLPSIISSVVLTTMFKFFIGVDGPIQELFIAFGGTKETFPLFFKQPGTAFPAILFYELWQGIGYSVIIMSGAIYRVPGEIFESGKLDGVSMWREFFQLVLPLIWPTLSTYITFKIASVFTYTGPIMLFTDGAYNTYTIGFYIFEQVKYWNQLYYPSAVSLFWTALGIPLVFVSKWFMEHFGDDIAY